MPPSPPAPLLIHRAVVLPEWIDYNNHMNVAYYVLAFDQAVDVFLDHIGLDASHRQRAGVTTFAAEAHVTYQREVGEGDPLVFLAQLLSFDSKRIRFFLEMRHAEEGFLAATVEWLSLHVDLASRRVVPMAPAIEERLRAVYAEQRGLPPPPEAGRGVGAPRTQRIPA